jgi:hypothetical protein
MHAALPSTLGYSMVSCDIVQRDVLVLKWLTLSLPGVLPLHGYCGSVFVVPHTVGGTLGNAIASCGDMPSKAKFCYAVNTVLGLANVHGCQRCVQGTEHQSVYDHRR